MCFKTKFKQTKINANEKKKVPSYLITMNNNKLIQFMNK